MATILTRARLRQRRTRTNTDNTMTTIATMITITIGGIGPPPPNNQCNKEELGEESGADITDSTAVGESTL